MSEFTSWDIIERVPELLSARTGGSAFGARFLDGAEQVVVAATGISYYSAMIAAELARPFSRIPVLLSRGYDVPAWVGPRTVFLAVSASGRDEELIYSIAAAGDRGAKCAVITGGGHLHEIASAQAYPEFRLTEETDHPVLELAGCFAAIWKALDVLLPASETDLSSTYDILTRQRNLMTEGNDQNPARLIAGALSHSAPHIYGSSGACAVAAQLWAHLITRATGRHTEFSSFALVDDLPESLRFSGLTEDAVVLLLRDSTDDVQMHERIDRWLTAAVSGRLTGRVHEVLADGRTSTERMWSTVHLGIWTACWLGI